MIPFVAAGNLGRLLSNRHPVGKSSCNGCRSWSLDNSLQHEATTHFCNLSSIGRSSTTESTSARPNVTTGIAPPRNTTNPVRKMKELKEKEKLKLIFRDFRPSNILIDHQMNAKVSNFGFAKQGPQLLKMDGLMSQ
ncbi:probable serine/threonine-protein kinase PBL1 [Tanacetum coccineum]